MNTGSGYREMMLNGRRIPAIDKRHEGLYLIDFKGHVSVGYTLSEVKQLLSDPRFTGCSAYLINRVYPDGRFELVGFNREQLSSKLYMIFWFERYEDSKFAFDELLGKSSYYKGGEEFRIWLARTRCNRYVLVLEYSAGLDRAVSDWLLRIGFEAGYSVELVGKEDSLNFIESRLDERLILSSEQRRSRPYKELLDTIEDVYQR